MSAIDDSLRQNLHALYNDHHGWLYRWLRRKLGCSENAADLAHDTFVRVMGSRRLNNNGSEPRALLTHIAKGLVIDHWRHQEVERAYQVALAQLPEPEVPSAEHRAIILEALHRIEAMLRSLPSRTQEIFLLSQLDGLNYREIARRVGTSQITVKRHMRQAFIACLSMS